MKHSLIALFFTLTLVGTIPTQAGERSYYNTTGNRHYSNHYSIGHSHYKGCGHKSSFYGAQSRSKREHYRSNYTLHQKTVYNNETNIAKGTTLESLKTKSYYNRSPGFNIREGEENPSDRGRAYVLDRSGYCYLISYKNGMQVRSQADPDDCY